MASKWSQTLTFEKGHEALNLKGPGVCVCPNDTAVDCTAKTSVRAKHLASVAGPAFPYLPQNM